MADNFRYYDTSKIPTSAMAQELDRIKMMYAIQRRSFERRWYDNNFFDDGFHFRYVSRTTGKIVDLTDKPQLNVPSRAIPKASRQIRGVANLLLQLEPTPTIYPDKVEQFNYPDPNDYARAQERARLIAQKSGDWIEQQWYEQHLKEKLILMLLLAAKHSVSFLKIYPDSVDEKICVDVYDAFDTYLKGDVDSIYKSPSIITAAPRLITKIQADDMFDPQAVERLNPDNKFAFSEVKEAYMRTRFGIGSMTDSGATLIQNEAFIKEYVKDVTDEEFMLQVQKSGKTGAMEGKKKGDMIMRHVFMAGGQVLLDEYADLPEYPFVDFRYEPGTVYQTPFIERFIPANKTLDTLVSRAEKFANTMVTGNWLKRKGENFEVTNIPGGQVLEYASTPPTQGVIANIPGFYFELIGLVEKFMEEQGASTSALNVIPQGVKSGVAIENLKATEYANLKIPTDQLKETIRLISERMLDIADKYFVTPQTVYKMDQGKPDYFDVVGQTARQRAGIPAPANAIPLKGSTVRIDVESGMGYTMEGKKETMQQIVTFMTNLAQQGLITQDALKVVVGKLLDTYKFGATQEFMEAMDSSTQTTPLSQQQLMQMKVAILETLKEAGVVGPEADQKLVDSTKVGVLESLTESGLINKGTNLGQPGASGGTSAKTPSESISFKDLPPEGKVQLAAQAGITLNPEQVKQDEVMKGGTNAPQVG